MIRHPFGLLLFMFLCLASMISCSTSPQITQTLVATTQPTYPTSTPQTFQVGLSKHTLTVGSLERRYLLYIPQILDKLQPVPLVFIFHGYTQMDSDMTVWGFNEVADKEGFLVVYPNGVDTAWNVSVCCGGALKKNIDEIAFIQQILADLGTHFSIDPKRIYSSGFSNGGILSYRLACEMSDTFAAIAPVEGYLLTNPCQPKQPVSVMEVHGLDDNYNGVHWTASDVGGYADVDAPPVEQTIATWVQLDGCAGEAQVEKQGKITHTTYDSCNAGTSVELDALEGGGHWWPSPEQYPALSPQGIWNFFKAHPKP